MAASDNVPILLKNRLHLAGRPQMSTRLSSSPAHLPLPNALAQYRIAKSNIGFRGKGFASSQACSREIVACDTS